MNKKIFYTAILAMLSFAAKAQVMADTTILDEVIVTSRVGTQRLSTATNSLKINRTELFKAACCNLGESFVTNPSVDVNYSDATTGAKQIKLLGLSGTYVQMLNENLPAARGAAIPYSLSFIPGPWMKSIALSKGNSSVKNGFEAMTGQINVEFLQPQDDEGATINIYGNTMGKLEANADGNIHLGSHLATTLMGHFENQWNEHDSNGDGFQDDPEVRQYNFMNRWYGQWDNYIMHAGLSLLDEHRSSGMTQHHSSDADMDLWRSIIDTRRYEGYMKHALLLDAEHGSNIALMGNVSMLLQDAAYGRKTYSVNEKNAYVSLVYETSLTPQHNLSLGASLNYDYLSQSYRLTNEDASPTRDHERETTPGGYVQYTYTLDSRIIAMAGLRVDHSSMYGTFATPRFHLKWTPASFVSLRLSAGKGYRTPHALAEMNYLLASGRTIVIDKLEQEAAWNYGLTAAFYISLCGKTLKLIAEYYYTDFLRQTLVDLDTDPTVLHITNLDGNSYSHTAQLDASYPVTRGLNLTLAYRYNLVKADYGGRMLWKPLQSKFKALAAVSWSIDPMGLRQPDATLAVNGGGRLPQNYTTSDGTPSWPDTFKAYPTLNAQVTRQFRHFSIYVGGENLTGYKQKNPILGAEQPWSSSFDPTMVYAPVSGAMAYAGVRINLGKHIF